MCILIGPHTRKTNRLKFGIDFFFVCRDVVPIFFLRFVVHLSEWECNFGGLTFFPISNFDIFCLQLECAPDGMVNMENSEDQDRKIVVEFCHLLEKSKQLFNGLRWVYRMQESPRQPHIHILNSFKFYLSVCVCVCVGICPHTIDAPFISMICKVY